MAKKTNWLSIWEIVKTILSLGIPLITKRLKKDKSSGVYTAEQIAKAQQLHDIIQRAIDAGVHYSTSFHECLTGDIIDCYNELYSKENK